jgi:CDP-6-deoxy-D-xylo-4-hexulose-3-dehydrase
MENLEVVNSIRVPYGMTVHGEEEIAAVVRCLRQSTQMGTHVRQMESRVAALFSKKHGIMVNSGSSALFLAMQILDLPQGSEVVTPVLTFATTVGSIVKNALVPAFVDVEADTFNIDVHKLESMIGPKTKAILVPNLIGNIPDWKTIRALADKHDLLVIEDSADTLGGTIGGKPTGYYSDISITSFYGSHVINCAGNGGMLCVNRDEWARRALLFRSWGRSSSLFVESENVENRFAVELEGIPYDAKFVFEDIGYNLEPNEMGAAFGLVQLDKLETNIRAREQAFANQLAFFSKFERWFIMPRQTAETRTGWLAFPVIVRDDAPFTRRDLQIFLERRNIQTRVVFTGNILRQPGFKNINCRTSPHRNYPNADGVMRGGMLLACHHGLTAPMLEHVHQSFEIFASLQPGQPCYGRHALVIRC